MTTICDLGYPRTVFFGPSGSQLSTQAFKDKTNRGKGYSGMAVKDLSKVRDIVRRTTDERF